LSENGSAHASTNSDNTPIFSNEYCSRARCRNAAAAAAEASQAGAPPEQVALEVMGVIP
jgi:hypothetical protein